MIRRQRETTARAETNIDGLLTLFAALQEARLAHRTIEPQPRRPGESVASFIETYAGMRLTAPDNHAALNAWDIAGLKRDEVRISAVLAWALNCRGSHGLGDAIALALMERLKQAGHRERLDRFVLGSKYVVHREFCAFGVRDDRVDVSIVGENCVLFIECKIDAPPGDKQLERYASGVAAKAQAEGKPNGIVLYLTGYARAHPLENVIALTWKDVAAAIRSAVRPTGQEQGISSTLLIQFADYVRRLH